MHRPYAQDGGEKEDEDDDDETEVDDDDETDGDEFDLVSEGDKKGASHDRRGSIR